MVVASRVVVHKNDGTEIRRQELYSVLMSPGLWSDVHCGCTAGNLQLLSSAQSVVVRHKNVSARRHYWKNVQLSFNRARAETNIVFGVDDACGLRRRGPQERSNRNTDIENKRISWSRVSVRTSVVDVVLATFVLPRRQSQECNGSKTDEEISIIFRMFPPPIQTLCLVLIMTLVASRVVAHKNNLIETRT
jgi:hypothetical protein